MAQGVKTRHPRRIAVAKASRYYKLVDATRGRTGQHTVEVTVWLKTTPPEPRRLWFSLRGMYNDGKGNLFAADWLIKKKNIFLRDQGATAGIRIDAEGSFLK